MNQKSEWREVRKFQRPLNSGDFHFRDIPMPSLFPLSAISRLGSGDFQGFSTWRIIFPSYLQASEGICHSFWGFWFLHIFISSLVSLLVTSLSNNDAVVLYPNPRLSIASSFRPLPTFSRTLAHRRNTRHLFVFGWSEFLPGSQSQR